MKEKIRDLLLRIPENQIYFMVVALSVGILIIGIVSFCLYLKRCEKKQYMPVNWTVILSIGGFIAAGEGFMNMPKEKSVESIFFVLLIVLGIGCLLTDFVLSFIALKSVFFALYNIVAQLLLGMMVITIVGAPFVYLIYVLGRRRFTTVYIMEK